MRAVVRVLLPQRLAMLCCHKFDVRRHAKLFICVPRVGSDNKCDACGQAHDEDVCDISLFLYVALEVLILFDFNDFLRFVQNYSFATVGRPAEIICKSGKLGLF